VGFGHKNLVAWKNTEELSKLVYEKLLPRIPKINNKLIDQIDRANTSVGANFIEGYYSGSTKEFIRFLSYSRRSLAEIEFWVNHCRMKRFISEQFHGNLIDLIIRTGFLFDRLVMALKRKVQE